MKKIILLLIIITLAFGAVSATSFPAPTAPAPAGNIVPVHTGIDQTKNGNLSVDNFIARAIADFRQQMYINNTNLGDPDEGEKGNMKGSSVATAENANTVIFGGVIENDPTDDTDDTTFNTSVVGTDIITAKNFLQSWNVSHDATIAQRRELCADAQGKVVFCKVAIAEVDVCANIQGTQTNPPAGMVRNGENCQWVVIVPPVPSLSIAYIGAESYTDDGSVNDMIRCQVTLNKENNTGSTLTFPMSVTYNYPNNAPQTYTQTCYPSVKNGEMTQDPNSPDIIAGLDTINPIAWCIDTSDPNISPGVVIPNALQC